MAVKLNVVESDASGRTWYEQGLQFSCTQCGNCCTGGPGYVWITQQEVARLAEHLGMGVEQVLRKYCRRIGERISLKERLNQGLHDCIFLQQEESSRQVEGQTVRYTKRTCSVYAVRPLQCRTWPFWKGNLSGKANWDFAGQRCPGINQGRLFSKEQIETIRDAAQWPDDPPGAG
jgi:hypothetical protein